MFYAKDADAERLIFPDWSPKTFEGVPFQLVDPQGRPRPQRGHAVRPARQVPAADAQSVDAAVQLAGQGDPHLLGGVSGWGFPCGQRRLACR